VSPINPSRRNVNPPALRLLPPRLRLLPALPIALSVLLTAAPFASSAARAQTLREAGEAAAEAQTKSCVAKALEWLKECEEEEEEEQEQKPERDRTPDRSGLGWTGIGLISAGGALVVSAATVDRWRSCGPTNRRTCQNIERRQGISGGVLLATGLTFLIVDEIRRHPEPYPRRQTRQTAITLSPRAIQVRMLF
jgi:hypothetical protein